MVNEDQSAYVTKVRRYYDEATPAYVSYLGRTLQAGRFERADATEPMTYRASNLALAERAGVRPGERILDAGCGVCGPAIDMASAYEGLKVDAMTVSPVQAELARQYVDAAGLRDRVTVHVGDYHQLPFEDESFDRVLFLESAGYSYDLARLFTNVRKVLRPGGTLYVKDVFQDQACPTPEEARDLEVFDQIYHQRTRTMETFAASITSAGLSLVKTFVFTEDVHTHAFDEAMIRTSPETGRSTLTEFGKLHYRRFERVPIVFGEIVAVRA